MEDIAIFSFQWWTQPLGTWMAWTRATAGFFIFIALAISAMGLIERAHPGGSPRLGIFAINTTRGDRLFITLLSSAFIFLGWLFFFGTPLWGPLIVSIIWGAIVFRYV